MTESTHLKIIVINSLVAPEGAGEAEQEQEQAYRARASVSHWLRIRSMPSTARRCWSFSTIGRRTAS
jgi:hypothetical protein